MREKTQGENHKERENQEKSKSATKSALFCSGERVGVKKSW